MNTALVDYIQSEIIPRYAGFDSAHQIDHAETVIRRSLELSDYYDVDKNMVYAIAAFHDTGLVAGRETHQLVSGTIIRTDRRLPEWFTPEQIETMAQAAEDHRASSDHEPRSIYGRIVAEADRIIDGDTIVRRTVQYGLSHYPLDGNVVDGQPDREWHWQRFLDHMAKKYDEGGYVKLWIPESPNAENLKKFRAFLKDRKALREKFDYYFDICHQSASNNSSSAPLKSK